MEQITWRIGEHLREVRNTRQMTLEDVAKFRAGAVLPHHQHPVENF